MKVGDLVTLSASALNRDTLFKWRPDCPEIIRKPKPLGIIIEVSCGRIGWVSKKVDRAVYKIKWMNPDGPKGREGDHGYLNVQYKGRFYRRDLKYVSRRKVKKA